MNTELEARAKRVLLAEAGAAHQQRWSAALAANQFTVHVLQAAADPLFAAALLQAAGTTPTLLIAGLTYFAGRNRNPYQFVKNFSRCFPQTAVVLVQPDGQQVTDAARAVAQRYGAVDLVPALPEGDAAEAVIEMLWFSACAQPPRASSRETPALPVAQQVAAQCRRALSIAGAIEQKEGRMFGAFDADATFLLAEKFSVSSEQLTGWFNEMVAGGALRSLSNASRFTAGAGRFRFFIDEPASIVLPASMEAAAGATAPATRQRAAPAAVSAGVAEHGTGPRLAADLDVQEVAQQMRKGETPLDVRDRSYLLKKYPKCFVGSEAVDWLARHHHLTRPQAVKLGERMFEAGLFHHVADDHDFTDGNFYFRFFADEEALPAVASKTRALDIDTLDVQHVATRMRGAGGVEVAARRYVLKSYPKCFIGTEAVDWLALNYRLSRPLAVKLGERMVAAGIFHHVADDHDFKDGDFFYRYFADE